jgi:transcriptional regulator with XRE-family HTH domain
MNNDLIRIDFPIQSYIENNREKLDESLVSLRLMKEIDMFLDAKDISNKLLAQDLGYSESFISQLMSGVKKINTSFINKFENNYNVKFRFSIEEEKEENFISIYSMSFLDINLNVSNNKNFKTVKISPEFNLGEYTEYEDIDNNSLCKNII